MHIRVCLSLSVRYSNLLLYHPDKVEISDNLSVGIGRAASGTYQLYAVDCGAALLSW
jgi:hypothetical protein